MMKCSRCHTPNRFTYVYALDSLIGETVGDTPAYVMRCQCCGNRAIVYILPDSITITNFSLDRE